MNSLENELAALIRSCGYTSNNQSGELAIAKKWDAEMERQQLMNNGTTNDVIRTIIDDKHD